MLLSFNKNQNLSLKSDRDFYELCCSKKRDQEKFHASIPPQVLPPSTVLSIIYKKLDACVFHDFKGLRKFSQVSWILPTRSLNIVYKKLLFNKKLRFSPESVTIMKFRGPISMKNTGWWELRISTSMQYTVYQSYHTQLSLEFSY